jgi:hypothetical protein
MHQGRSRLAELAPVAALVMAFFGVLLWLIAAKMIFDLI